MVILFCNRSRGLGDFFCSLIASYCRKTLRKILINVAQCPLILSKRAVPLHATKALAGEEV
jgi:hypothetical protein